MEAARNRAAQARAGRTRAGRARAARAAGALLLATAAALGGLAGSGTPAGADVPGGSVVAEAPAPRTPHVLDGRVYSVTQVGGTIVLGGTFTRARNDGSATELTRRGLLAFDAATGQILPAFAPNPNGEVRVVVPSGDGSTVYVGGGFTSLGGVTRSRVARLRVSDGAVVTAFNAGAVTGGVRDLALRGGRLWLGGAFTHVGGRAQAALTSVDPTTGAPQPYMALPVAGIHNDGVTQVLKLDVSPDGSRLVAVGNFDTLAGAQSHQLLQLDLSGPTAQPAPFRTDFYLTPCSQSFDTYMRDVDFSPDGSFFVVSTTGAYGGPDTACDTTARFETLDGPGARPSWVNHTGGDTTYGVEITPGAVYVGGHHRWQNNPFAGDTAGPGAISREGLAALDPVNGLPLSWDPTRTKGVGVFDFLATEQGLWVASDTDRIGAYVYKGRIALMPRAGGTTYPAQVTPRLPNDVYLGGATGSVPDPRVLYRVNAGGPEVPAPTGPAWAADTDAQPSSLHGPGSNRAAWSPSASFDATVPAGTPPELFDTELWDPDGGPEQAWDFPVPAGTPLEVRLYFANRCGCTSQVGQRRFHVDLDGVRVLDDFDIVGEVGDQRATVRRFPLTSDGNVDVDLTHLVENPLLNAVEVVRTDLPAPAPAGDGLRRIRVGTGPATGGDAPDGDVDWAGVTGAFMDGGRVYLGLSDGSFVRRAFDGSTWGPAQAVDLSDRLVPLAAWHADLRSMRGMFLDDGRVYFTLPGQDRLFYRYFTPESGAVGAQRYVAAQGVDGIPLGSARGVFVAGDRFYWAEPDGNLRSAAWQRGGASGRPVGGTARLESGPASGEGVTWGTRATFVHNGPGGPVLAPPVAAFTSSCTDLTCRFDSSGSSGSGGALTSRSWDFGDGSAATGAAPTHTFDAPGTYDVTLTVTTSAGSDQQTSTVTVTAPPAGAGEVTVVGVTGSNANSTTHRVAVPPGTQAGDLLLLHATANSTGVTLAAPAGWTALSARSGGNTQGAVWRRTATAGDAGGTVALTTSGTAKVDASLAAYRGSLGTPVVRDHGSVLHQSGATSFAAPAAGVDEPGSWVVRSWAAKTSDDVAWTLPGGLQERRTAAGSGGGRIVAVLGDSAGPVPTGAAGALSATTDVAVTRVFAATTVLAPE